MVNITAEEVTRLAAYLNKPESEVQEQYVETGANNSMMVLNAVPCPFLKGNCCSIYEQRFTECREFPALHQPHFVNRLFAMLMHYGRCPIIYNVLEALKSKLEFVSS